MKTPLLLSVLMTFSASIRADVLGTTLSNLTLADGQRLTDVRVLRASPEKHTVTISTNRSIRSLPLDQLPEDLRRQILLDCRRVSASRERKVMPSPTATVKTTDASAPIIPADTTPAGRSEPMLTDLTKRAATQAPDELLMYLQKNYQRVSGLNCIIRTNEKIAGWPQVRVAGTASFSMWDNYRHDYVHRVARFEVEFEILNGEKLRANTVTFDGISGRIDP